MIIVNDKCVAKAAARVGVVETVAGFDITIAGQTIQFDKSKLEFAPDAAFISVNDVGQVVMFWQSEISGTRDASSAIGLRKRVDVNAASDVVILIAPDMKLHVICQGCAYVSADENTVIVERGQDGGISPRQVIMEYIPEMVEYSERNRIKIEAIGRFNPVDSVAGLEFQIDLLTTAVKLLIEKIPADERPSWWSAFETAAVGNSSLNLLGESVAISRVAEEKTKTRANQADYYGKLAAIRV